MGSTDEFGADGDRIRAWLAKRDSYADDARTTPAHRAGVPAPPPGQRVARTSAPPSDGPDANEVGRAIVAAVDASAAPRAGASAPAAPSAPAGTDATADIAATASLGTDSTALARSVVEALRSSPTGSTAPAARTAPAPAVDEPAREATPTAERQVRVSATPAARRGERPREAVTPQVQHTRWSEPADVVHEADASTDVRFTPRSGVRRALSLGLVFTLGFAALMGYVAYHEPSRTTVGVAAVAGVLCLVVWAVRAGAVPTQLSIERGQLVLRRNGRLEVVDLASPYTPIAVVGEPGLRGWAVLVERMDEPLIEITDSMVDPYWFTTALYRIRPELRPGAQPAEQR